MVPACDDWTECRRQGNHSGHPKSARNPEHELVANVGKVLIGGFMTDTGFVSRAVVHASDPTNIGAKANWHEIRRPT